MTIWNLSKGEIYFSGAIELYQNYIKETWHGRYSLDSLDSFANQFVEHNKGKSHICQDRYLLWTCYKDKSLSSKKAIEKMLEDIPDNFSPQRDSPDFFELVHGKSFLIRNNEVKVYTNTAIIQNDFTSILKAANTIMQAIYFKEKPTELAFIEIELRPESIDVSRINMDDKPYADLEFKLTQQEASAKTFSFTIHFDLEISSVFSAESVKKYRDINPGVEKLDDLDSILLYLMYTISNPGKIHFDKENHLYFATPKDQHEQDLIYSAKIMESLAQAKRPSTDEDFILFWMEYFSEMTTKERIDYGKKLLSDINRQEAIRDYTQKYSIDDKISKEILMEHLKTAININPLDFVDDKNGFIANYAKAIISGDAV